MEGKCSYCCIKMGGGGGCGRREIIYRRKCSGRQKERKPTSKFAVDCLYIAFSYRCFCECSVYARVRARVHTHVCVRDTRLCREALCLL